MLTQYLHMGGLERMIFNLSTALKAQGDWEPQVFVYDRLPDAGAENDLGPAFANARIPVTSFLKPPGFSPRLALAIHRKLSAEHITVLHTHDLGPLIYGVCAKLLSCGRVRLIHTEHSFVHLSRRWVYKYYERLFARFADEVAVVSDEMRRTYLELGVPPDKLHVVPNGVRFPEQGPLSAATKAQNRKDLLGKLEASAREALGPFMECRWILYMARLHRVKGQDHALELWRGISPRARGKSVLLFVGPESESGRLKDLRAGIASAPDSSQILYLGPTQCPELWLGCCDLALSCSEFEGMPLGPIEAAGAGLPLVLSEIPGHAVVKAWSAQYPLSDPSAGARTVERILEETEADQDDRFKSLWEKAGEVRSLYTLAHMSSDYSRLYSSAGRTRVHSNFSSLDGVARDDERFAHEYLGEESSLAASVRMLWRARWAADFVIINNDSKRLLLACALFLMISPRPFRRCRIVSVDILLRPPKTVRDRIVNVFKSMLLRQVDLFILYFKNIDGYVNYFHIPRDRIAYVPFKANSWEKLRARRAEIGEGDYVLLSGATLRDHATFVGAMAKCEVRGLLLIPGADRTKIERTSWYLRGIPPNLRVEFHTDGKEETYLRYLEGARIVCFPRFAWDIASSGISGYLCSMALGKFVAISRGPGADDVLAETEAAAFFEPEDPDGLARLITQAWEQAEFRRRIAANGARYADALQGEDRLLRDILRISMDRAGL
jgi:glycosyltransferase involved in cell wall biosynthesis